MAPEAAEPLPHLSRWVDLDTNASGEAVIITERNQQRGPLLVAGRQFNSWSFLNGSLGLNSYTPLTIARIRPRGFSFEPASPEEFGSIAGSRGQAVMRPRSRRPGTSSHDRSMTGEKGIKPMSDQAHVATVQSADSNQVAPPEDSFEELDDMEFLDDVDFTLDDVENKIAPLALAHH